MIATLLFTLCITTQDGGNTQCRDYHRSFSSIEQCLDASYTLNASPETIPRSWTNSDPIAFGQPYIAGIAVCDESG
jgi:hypothetical protein